MADDRRGQGNEGQVRPRWLWKDQSKGRTSGGTDKEEVDAGREGGRLGGRAALRPRPDSSCVLRRHPSRGRKRGFLDPQAEAEPDATVMAPLPHGIHSPEWRGGDGCHTSCTEAI